MVQEKVPQALSCLIFKTVLQTEARSPEGREAMSLPSAEVCVLNGHFGLQGSCPSFEPGSLQAVANGYSLVLRKQNFFHLLLTSGWDGSITIQYTELSAPINPLYP